MQEKKRLTWLNVMRPSRCLSERFIENSLAKDKEVQSIIDSDTGTHVCTVTIHDHHSMTVTCTKKAEFSVMYNLHCKRNKVSKFVNRQRTDNMASVL